MFEDSEREIQGYQKRLLHEFLEILAPSSSSPYGAYARDLARRGGGAQEGASRTASRAGVDNFGRWRRNWYVKHDFGYYEHEEEYTDAAGIKRIRRTGYHGPNFHSLRHTQATVLIGSGADVKAVQDRLGHAQASTTLNIYAEAQRSKERATASMMSQLIRSKTQTP